MKYYIKSGARAALKAFQTLDFTECDKIDSHNNTILEKLFKQLETNEIKLFYQRTKTRLIIAHRSTRNGVLIQISHMYINGGKLIPVMHSNINTLEDLTRSHDFAVGYIRTK